jgi:type II secretory pathway pseudopilin PulG
VIKAAPETRIPQRGIALITSLLAIALVLALLAVMVDIDTARLRRTNEETRAAQALAAADAGAQWVRALFAQHFGDLSAVLTDLSKAHSTSTFGVDATTTADVRVSLWLPGSTTHVDHLDINLQENPQIDETPVQIGATATITAGGHVVATRTVTTLLRSFHNVLPYSEVVGVIDDAGPSAVFSPGDPAGQVGSAYATDLRIQASTQTGTSTPAPANKFQNDVWSDGNLGSPGFLP